MFRVLLKDNDGNYTAVAVKEIYWDDDIFGVKDDTNICGEQCTSGLVLYTASDEYIYLEEVLDASCALKAVTTGYLDLSMYSWDFIDDGEEEV